MTVYLTGDIHGMGDDPERFDIWSFPEGDDLTRDDIVVVLGDFGLPSDLLADDGALQDLNAKPWTTCFVDGNHECYPYLQRLELERWNGGLVQRFPGFPNIIHLMRGEVYDLDGRSFLVMGGARSVDRYFQQANGTWYPEEMPDGFEYRNARENLEKRHWTVDCVLSHTCSTRMLAAALGCSGMPTEHVVSDELNEFFEDLERELDYGHWFFGHFHHDTELDSRHTVVYQSFADVEDYL